MSTTREEEEVYLDFFGLNLIYFKQREHGVGVIAPPFLPAKALTYRVHFSFSLQVPESSPFFIPTIAGAALGPQFEFDSSTTPVSYVFDLRLVSSRPIFNKIIKATQEDVDNGYLTVPKNILMTGYVVKLTPTEESEGVILDVTDAQEDIPGKPSDDDRVGYADDYFNYYQQFRDPNFSIGDINSETNIFQNLEKPPGHDFRYDRSRFFERDGTSNHIVLKQPIEKDAYYAVTYDEITDYYYSQFHRVNLVYNTISIVPGVANNFPSVRPSPMRFFAYKEWNDITGQKLKGWRISETYVDSSITANVLDSNGNISGQIQKTDKHVFFNMVDESLQKKDEQRIGYEDRIVEEYLELAKTRGPTQEGENFDVDRLTPDQVRSDNFVIYQSNDNRVVGGTYTNPAANLVFDITDTALAFQNKGNPQFVYWDSDLHFKQFTKNTRIVLAFDSGISQNTIITFASVEDVAIRSQSSAQDPLYFNVTDGRLGFYVFGDSEFDMDIPNYSEKDLEFRQNKFGSSAHLGVVNNDGTTGNSLLLENFSYNTNIDDSGLSSSPQSPEQVSNVSLVVTSETPVSIDSENDTIGFNVDSDYIFDKIIIEQDGVSAFVKIRGWTSKPDELGVASYFDSDEQPLFEKSSVYIIGDQATVSLQGWGGISYIEILGASGVPSFTIVNKDESPNNFIEDADTVACMAGERGVFACFYTTGGGRCNLLISNDSTISWKNYENIFMRGDKIGSLRSIVNQDDDTLILFHYYKEQSILMTTLPLSVVNYDYKDAYQEAALLDQIRTQQCYLVWGDIDNSEGIQQNVFTTSEEFLEFMLTRFAPVVIENADEDTDFPTFNLAESNKFISVGGITKKNLLSRQDAPRDADYDVYQNDRGIIRLMAKNDDGIIRFLESSDSGINWSDVWDIESDIKIKINSLRPISGEEVDEATFVTTIYNGFEKKLYVFYVFNDAFLFKVIDDNAFYPSFNLQTVDNPEEFVQQALADYINSLPIYALAGDLNSIEGYRYNVDDNPIDDEEVFTSNLFFNDFQKNEENYMKFYNELKYPLQKITGYTTNKGYMRVFFVSNNKTIDSYYYDGDQWYPENVMLLDDQINT